MAYSDFTLNDVVDRFGLKTSEQPGLFGSLPPVMPSTILATLLQRQVLLAVAMNTEKARSELIIINFLTEIREMFHHTVSIFSGVDFSVDAAQGLNGFCDFLISLSPEQVLVRAPVIAVVEAKKGNLPDAFAQCFAEMVAAQRFNQRHASPIEHIYGVITSGTDWLFVMLHDQTVTIDLQEYSVSQPERILGILSAMVRQEVPPSLDTQGNNA